MNDLVSIVVPVYNMGDSIEKCVESILCQTYRNIEIILVDDGSKDDSYSHCKILESRDKRVKAFHTENRGSGPARNYGIEQANGEYIYFPDADDYMEKNAIQTMIDATDDGRYDLVVFGYKSLNQVGKEVLTKEFATMTINATKARNDYSDFIGSTRKYAIQGAPWNKFFNLNLIKRNKIEYPPLRRHQDDCFIARYMCHAKQICFIPDILYIHYINDLKNEWEKFPVNYIDNIIGLYNSRKETILTWNLEDKKTHELIKYEFLTKVVKAIELSFSPKFKTRKDKENNINIIILKSDISNFSFPDDDTYIYQKLIFKLIKKRKIKTLYNIVKLKVFCENHFPNLKKYIKGVR